ncbi:MAG: ChaN family lipoprotein [Leptolyngbyaceae cyanobacterium]
MANRLRRCHLGWALVSSAVLFVAPIACSADETPLTITPGETASLSAQDIQPLLGADVVYLGEQHDSEADHAAQLEIIKAVHAENANIAIALEMFQRPFQPVIDRYLAGEISEAELVEQTEYLERWGFPWEYYAPFLRFAQENQLPVLALNAPGEVVSKVAREGLASLEGEELRYIPPISDIDTSNEDYRAFVSSIFGSHGGHDNFNFDNFFAAQVTWDETMAETIVTFKQTSPDTLVIVLTGNAHVMYGYGIPDRVARRLGDSVQQTKVLLNFPEEFIDGDPGEIADILWYSE